MEGKETTFYEKKKILSLACPFVRDISYGIVKCVDVGNFKMNRQASHDCLGTDNRQRMFQCLRCICRSKTLCESTGNVLGMG